MCIFKTVTNIIEPLKFKNQLEYFILFDVTNIRLSLFIDLTYIKIL